MEHVAVSQSETTALTPTCPEKDSPPEIVTIDADGDLHLTVGENKCIGKLSTTGPPPAIISGRRDRGSHRIKGRRSRGNCSGRGGGGNRCEFSRSVSHRRLRGPRPAGGSEMPWQQEHQHKKAVTYVVCSKTLSRSSPVFKRLLYGGFAESKKPEAGGQWTVCLPEDEPAPMETILNIAHGRFDQVPTKWDTVKDLYLLTVLTDKYDLTHLLRPWARGWMRAVRTSYDAEKEDHWPTSPPEIASQCLWIAWELGDEDSVELLFHDIVYGSGLDESGQLENMSWEKSALVFEDVMEPPGMVG
ncbi:hypothetical protein DL771_003569 [Monosporascus sp. 5C6A]|nr:hypothetical protein DL771_003569 [Monosporascus sp. 5C6A]